MMTIADTLMEEGIEKSGHGLDPLIVLSWQSHWLCHNSGQYTFQEHYHELFHFSRSNESFDEAVSDVSERSNSSVQSSRYAPCQCDVGSKESMSKSFANSPY